METPLNKTQEEMDLEKFLKEIRESTEQAREDLKNATEALLKIEKENTGEIGEEKRPSWLKKNALRLGLAAGIAIGGVYGAKKVGEYAGGIGYKDPVEEAGKKELKKETKPATVSIPTIAPGPAPEYITIKPEPVVIKGDEIVPIKPVTLASSKTEAEIKANLEARFAEELAKREILFSNRLATAEAAKTAPAPALKSEPETPETPLELTARIRAIENPEEKIKEIRKLNGDTIEEIEFKINLAEKLGIEPNLVVTPREAREHNRWLMRRPQ